MYRIRRSIALLILLLVSALLFPACAPAADSNRLSLTEAEKQEWTAFLTERFIAVLPEFQRNAGSGDLDLTGYLFRYLWEKRDGATLAPFAEAVYEKPDSPIKREAMRIPLAELNQAAVYLFNQTPAAYRGCGPLAVQDDFLWVFPHGLEEGPTLPRIVECIANSDDTLTFRVEFYFDEYAFNGNTMHGADGTELNHDEFLAKLKDETFQFKEAPLFIRQITVQEVNDAAGNRYVIVENVEA